jgi:hypothetical protein
MHDPKIAEDVYMHDTKIIEGKDVSYKDHTRQRCLMHKDYRKKKILLDAKITQDKDM